MLLQNKKILTTLACLTAVAAVALRAQQTKPPAAAQPQAQPQKEEGATFKAETRLVVLPTTVVDKNGHLVTDLTKDQFTVYENGVVQPIAKFKREDVPVSLGLIIDNSG